LSGRPWNSNRCPPPGENHKKSAVGCSGGLVASVPACGGDHASAGSFGRCTSVCACRWLNAARRSRRPRSRFDLLGCARRPERSRRSFSVDRADALTFDRYDPVIDFRGVAPSSYRCSCQVTISPNQTPKQTKFYRCHDSVLGALCRARSIAEFFAVWRQPAHRQAFCDRTAAAS
jgi:hypothetical protein